jgi:hypothetical protein
MSWIQTYTGRQFYPLTARPIDIDARDIAHALSMLCRYGGHCNKFYSVAEHSVLMARALDPKHRKWAVLHDAPEAYLVDVPKPLKVHLGDYEMIERHLMQVICERFNLPAEAPPAVKRADMRIMMDERAQNMGRSPQPWAVETVPLGVDLQFWPPEKAKQEYMAELTRALQYEAA